MKKEKNNIENKGKKLCHTYDIVDQSVLDKNRLANDKSVQFRRGQCHLTDIFNAYALLASNTTNLSRFNLSKLCNRPTMPHLLAVSPI